MITLFPPAKRLNETDVNYGFSPTQPIFKKEASVLARKLKKLSKQEIIDLMNVSESIAATNYQRFKEFTESHTQKNSYPALCLYNGDTHQQINYENFTKDNFDFAAKNTLIVSGLYGLIRPTDLIQPYRLEMGRKISGKGYQNLYEYWEEKIAAQINTMLEGHKDKTVLNVCSQEYAKSVKSKKINGHVVQVTFKESREGTFKAIGVLAKKARGMMVDYIIKNKISNHKEVKNFTRDGYEYNANLSSADEYVFTR